MEFFILTVTLIAAVATLWRSYVERQRIIIETEKLATENKERQLESLSRTQEAYDTSTLNISKHFFQSLETEIDEVEAQSIQYISSKGRSDSCVIFISGLGLDHRDFERHISSFTEYECIALSVYGFEPNISSHYHISIDDHVKILCHVINRLTEGGNYKTISLVGFSIGGDLSLMIASSDRLNITLNAVIALDPNIDDSTTFISSHLGAIGKRYSPLEVVNEISKGKQWNSIDKWIDTHRYLVAIFSKFGKTRLSFLQNFSEQVAKKYSNNGIENFLHIVTKATVNSELVKIVFSDDMNHQKAIFNALKNNDSVCIKIVEGAGHFDLINDLVITKTLLEKI